MFKLILLALMNAVLINSNFVKPVIGILPFQVPQEIEEELKEKKNYISVGFSRWFETYHTRWIPVSLNDPKLKDILKEINGIAIMGEVEAYSNEELVKKYKADLLHLVNIVEAENSARYFPLIGVGFGAQLLFSVLTESKYNLIEVAELKNKLLKFDYTDNDSTLKKLEPNYKSVFTGNYPNIGTHFIPMEIFDKNQSLKDKFHVIATTTVDSKNKKQALGFFELKTFPIFGLLSDFHTMHFSHGLLNGPITDEDLDRGFNLAKFWSDLLKKNPVSTKNDFVLQQKKNLKYFSSLKNSELFEEMFLKEL